MLEITFCARPRVLDAAAGEGELVFWLTRDEATLSNGAEVSTAVSRRFLECRFRMAHKFSGKMKPLKRLKFAGVAAAAHTLR